MRLSLRRFAGTANGDAATLDGLDSTAFLLADGSRAGATDGLQAFEDGIVTGVVRPASDSATAVRVQNAAGSTSVLTVDTINARMGMGGVTSAKFSIDDGNGILYLNGNGMFVDRAVAYFGTQQSGQNFRIQSDVFSQYDRSNTIVRLWTDATGVGFFQISPTAVVDIAAATTSRASLRIRSGTAPTSPNDGDIWKLSDAFVMHGSDATTGSIVNTLRLRRNSTGTPAAGFGGALQMQLKSSTTAGRDAGRLSWEWATATDASRAARGKLTAYSTTTEQEAIRWDGDSGGVKLGFYGVSAVARQTLATGAGATVDNVIAALQNLGLVKQS